MSMGVRICAHMYVSPCYLSACVCSVGGVDSLLCSNDRGIVNSRSQSAAEVTAVCSTSRPSKCSWQSLPAHWSVHCSCSTSKLYKVTVDTSAVISQKFLIVILALSAYLFV